MPTWWRYNPATHIFEQSLNEGTSWAPPPLNASVINEGVFAPARIPAITSGQLPANVAYKDINNNFSAFQKIDANFGGIALSHSPAAVDQRNFALFSRGASLDLEVVADNQNTQKVVSQTTRAGNVNYYGNISILKPDALVNLYDTSQPANLVVFRIINNSQRLHLQALTDAGISQGYASIGRDGSIIERNRSVPMGDWTDFTPAFSGPAVPVMSTNSNTSYTLVGRTITLNFRWILNITGVGGWFSLTLPPVVSGKYTGTMYSFDAIASFMYVEAGSTGLILTYNNFTANFPTGLHTFNGSFSFQIN